MTNLKLYAAASGKQINYQFLHDMARRHALHNVRATCITLTSTKERRGQSQSQQTCKNVHIT
jgi:hypothetical protein